MRQVRMGVDSILDVEIIKWPNEILMGHCERGYITLD